MTQKLEKRELHRITLLVLAKISEHYGEDNDVRFKAEYTDVQFGGGNRRIGFMHSIECVASSTVDDDSKPPILFVPGYSAGVLLFANNMADLAIRTGCKVYAVDWLGFAGSSRPRWKKKSIGDSVKFFTSTLEQWIERKGLRDIVLIAHSFGGYLASRFVLELEERMRNGDSQPEGVLRSVVLASPAGIPAQGIDIVKKGLYLKMEAKTISMGITPQNMLNKVPKSVGLKLARWIVRNRFGTSDRNLGIPALEGQGELMVAYMYSIMTGRASSSIAFFTLLDPVTWIAHEPLEEEFKHIKTWPILFVFGDEKDWMKNRQWDAVSPDLMDTIPAKSEAVIIPDSNHHVYLKHFDQFDDQVIRFCDLDA